MTLVFDLTTTEVHEHMPGQLPIYLTANLTLGVEVKYVKWIIENQGLRARIGPASDGKTRIGVSQDCETWWALDSPMLAAMQQLGVLEGFKSRTELKQEVTIL